VLWATLAETRRSVWMIARGDQGIHGPADVAGRRVGVPRGTTAEVYLLAFLDLYGIEREQVRVIDIAPEKAESELASGAIDVACIWEPFATKVRRAVEQPVIMHDDFIYRMTWNLVGLRDGPPVPVERVLRGIDAADRRMLADDPRVIAEVARWCPLEPESVRRAVPDYHFALQLEGSLLTEIEEQVRLLDGRSAAVPDVLRMIDPGPLSRVLPEAVAIPGHDAR
jgi:NitT/TauT family transport system substrate-binding protein